MEILLWNGIGSGFFRSGGICILTLSGNVFERFYRGRNSGDKDGVGIGLYLSREIIEKQGGMLSVIPQKDGNKFVIVLQSR